MDINDFRTMVMVLGFLLFISLVVRVWRPRAQQAHEQASQLVFQGEGDPMRNAKAGMDHG